MAFDPSKLLQGLPIVGDVLGGIITNQGNKKLAELNQNFQAQQAQLARDWQEDMFNLYSSPSAMVQQYKDAGLNPALMYGKGQSIGQSFGTSSPSGAQATLSNPADNLLAKMQSITQLKETIANNRAMREVQSAQAGLLRSQMFGQDIENQFNPKVFELNLKQGKLNLQNTIAGIKLAESQVKLNLDGLLNNDVTRRYYNNLSDKVGAETAKTILEQSLVVANTILAKHQGYQISLDNFEKEWRNAMIATKGINPEIANNAWSLMTQATAEASNRIVGGVTKAVNWIKSDPLKQLYNRYFGTK